MRAYVVQPGDYLKKIAFKFGVAPDAIWNHQRNKDLKDKRANANILNPGDTIYIPDPEERQSFGLSVGGSNRFQVNPQKTLVRIALKDENGAMQKEPYDVVGAGPSVISGVTDGDGVLEVEVRVTVRSITVKLPNRHRSLRFDIGHLDPVEVHSGVVSRLENLGFISRAIEALMSEAGNEIKARLGRTDPAVIARAIKLFQKSKELKETGEINQETRDALAEEHQS